MARYACEVCKTEGDVIEFGICKRDHPESVRKVLEKNADETWVLNVTGDTVPFKTIDSENLNKLLVFKATIMSTTDIGNYDISKVFVCPSCKAEKRMMCDEFRDIFDKDFIAICKDCEKSPMYLDRSQTVVGNLRKVLLQEVNDESGINPRRIEAHITSKNVFTLEAGKDYMFEAKLWSVSFGKKNENYNRFVLDVNRIRCLDEDTSKMPDANELAYLLQVDKKLIVESLAPKIIFRSNEKMACLISYLSGGRLDGIRGDISTLFVGDPSTGKSQLLNALHALDKKSFKISGRSTSAAGMVMGVDNLPDGTRMATFGPVILANNHFVCIDEMDKMQPEDRSMLHDVMEDEVAHLNKVGINITMPAQTKIIGAANPKASRYDKKATIMANIGMPNSFLARFGYIFLVTDDFTPEQERAKLKRINYIKVNGLDSFIESEGLLTQDLLIKYLNHAKSISPVFQAESLAKLEDLYIELKFRKQLEGSIDIDTRAYEDIIRASYSFARFRLSNKVEILDVNMAWNLYTLSLNSFGMNTKGEFVTTQLSTRDNTREQYVTECLEQCSMSGMINIDSFKLKLMENTKLFKTLGITDSVVHDLKKEGRLLATAANGVFRYNG